MDNPALLVAVQLTMVVPSGKVAPEAGEHTTPTGELMVSEPVAENETAAPAALVASAVILAGRLRDGGVKSIFTFNVAVEDKPALFVHVALTVVPVVSEERVWSTAEQETGLLVVSVKLV